MPVVQSPVVNLTNQIPEYDFSGLGQLGRALLEYYRRQGQGQYVAQQDIARTGFPTVRAGETFPAQAVPRRQAPPPGFAFQPNRLSFLGPQYTDPQQLQQQTNVATLQKTQAETGNLQAQAEFYRRYPELLTGVSPSGTPELQPTSPEPPSSPQTSRKTETEQAFTPTPISGPGILAETASRAAGRGLRMRETQRGLTQTFQARTTTAARGLGDAANISEREREMLLESFPSDSDSFEGRLSKEDATIRLFDVLEQRAASVLAIPYRMVLKGVSKQGPRFEVDPIIQTQKRKAVDDLRKIQQTRDLYQKMYQEAAQKMPPIGAVPKNGQVVLMRDAQGNRAYVYPDGRVEEIQ